MKHGFVKFILCILCIMILLPDMVYGEKYQIGNIQETEELGEAEETETKEETEEAEEIKEPEKTEEPEKSEITEETEKPEKTEVTEETEITEEPEETEESEITEEPEKPEETEESEIVEETEETEETEESEEIIGISRKNTEMEEGAALDDKTFSDQNFREYLKQYDLDHDQILSPSEIKKITKINVNMQYQEENQKITSLEGIEYFKDLEELDCSYNALDSLDIRKCKKLQYLKCYDCGLRRLVVKGSKNLKVILAGKNYFTNINLSGCTALTELDVSIGSLKSLDVSPCAELQSLKCNSNKMLTSLEIRACTKLKELYCYNTDMENLNLTGLGKLEVLNCSNNNSLKNLDLADLYVLQKLYCGGGNTSTNYGLVNLTIRNCNELQNVTLKKGVVSTLNIENCTKLESVNCSDNELTQLNLKGCVNLKKLYCGRNRLLRLDASGCTAIEEIYCEHNSTTMTLSVKDCTKLTNLYCYESNITAINLSGCKKLKILNCRENQIKKIAVSEIPSIQYFRCDNNNLTKINVTKLKNLLWFDCSENKISTLNLENNKNLNRIACEGNLLRKLDVTNCKKLVQLNCNKNKIGTLDLSRNELLENLACEDNLLERLDVSKCSNLMLLRCSRNRLYQLDIRENTNLIGISCYDNCYVVKAGDTLDVRTLDQFEISRASNWAGCIRSDNGTGCVMELSDRDTNIITYEYDINRGFYIRFSIKFEKPDSKIDVNNLAWGCVDRYTYTGKKINAYVFTVTGMEKGKTYSLSYKNNKNPGKATVVIKGKGKYTGVVRLNYLILPARPEVNKISGKQRKKITVCWKRDKLVSGYEIRYATDKKLKKDAGSKLVNNNKTVKAVISKLMGGKVYYIEARSYIKVDGKKVYSEWGERQKVNVKK